MNNLELSRQVLKRRKEMNLSQEELAQRAEVSRNYISLIERGEASNVSIKVLNQLAIALEATPGELTGQIERTDTLVDPALRQFGLEHGLSFEVVDKLSRIPARGKKPQTVNDWQKLYNAVRPFLEDAD